MKSCVIFDFDGVIAETESQHFTAYNLALADLADRIGGTLVIAEDLYDERYIPYGDREGFEHMLADHGRPFTPELIGELIAAKSAHIVSLLARVHEPLPGVREALDTLDRLGVPRAICSSAHLAEIEQVLATCGLSGRFAAIVAVDHVTHSKPAPEGYTKAFDRLSELCGRGLDRASSMAIEDTAGGARAARESGLRVLGIAGTLPLAVIAARTTWAVNSLADVTEADWRSWLGLDRASMPLPTLRVGLP